MSPEKAKVFVVEDDKFWQMAIKGVLEDAGHSVVASATTLDEALVMVEQLKEMGVDVAVLDGNLDPDEYQGFDGQTVLRAIQEKAPEVKTIGMSGNSVKGTDIDLGKGNAVELGEVVSNL